MMNLAKKKKKRKKERNTHTHASRKNVAFFFVFFFCLLTSFDIILARPICPLRAEFAKAAFKFRKTRSKNSHWDVYVLNETLNLAISRCSFAENWERQSTSKRITRRAECCLRTLF